MSKASKRRRQDEEDEADAPAPLFTPVRRLLFTHVFGSEEVADMSESHLRRKAERSTGRSSDASPASTMHRRPLSQVRTRVRRAKRELVG